MHAESGEEIAVFATGDGQRGYEALPCQVALGLLTNSMARGGAGSLLEAVARRWLVPEILESQCHWPLLLSEVVRNFDMSTPVKYVHGLKKQELEDLAQSYHQSHVTTGRGIQGSNINVRRLPNWTRSGRGENGTQAIAELLGLAGQVEFAHSFLWLGVSAGGLHLDIQDNVLIQINGESHAFVIPANCSRIEDTPFESNSATEEWFSQQGADAPPYFHITLRPGDGLVIPSNSMHAVVSQDASRIGLNLFFEPRFGAMRWPAAPNNYYNHAGEGHLAVRALWLKTLAELWDSGALGSRSYIVHGQRQELI
uniref:Cupin-like domain-containing protein n=1 Tax=Alexandrium catenella TaxID=2925 RepID=A0A7S1MHV5_ALECA|mmetsp:Transcript_27201/g.73830  ORF Transcript_27201/g.73830 Transcript_27201/m.73830 type:complete len:311 (+) Transcript_27201:3-935(+)